MPISPEGYHALAAEHGFTWLGPEVSNIRTKTGWQCPQGHQWPACYGSIQQGSGCPECLKVSAEDYHALAAERGFTWLGPEVPNVSVPTRWRCPRGHQWLARYSNIQQGSGCPECAEMSKLGRSTRRKEPEDYHALAADRGFIWLGPEVSNIRTKTGWRCPRRHQWLARYSNIQQGSSCPECLKVSAEDYHALATHRGFIWLGPEVPDSLTKTRWQCPFGHQWLARYNSIQRGTGCPRCAKANIRGGNA